MSILGTIGLCRWRARKLRKLRDIERLEKEKAGEDDENSDSASTGSGSDRSSEKDGKKRKKSVANGSSSAIRKIHKRLSRYRRRQRLRKSETVQEYVGDQRSVARVRPEDSSAASTVSATTSSSISHRSRSSISHRSAAAALGTTEDAAPLGDPPNDAMEPPPPPLPPIHPDSMGSTTGDGGRERGRPRITITSSEITPPPPLDPPTPNAEPPAYPTSTTSSGNLLIRARTSVDDRSPIPEKAPIPGLEAEYDDRDLASYTTSGLFDSRLSTSGTRLSVRSSAPPTRRPSRVRFVDEAEERQRVDGGGGKDGQDEQGEPEEQVPSFEPFAFDSSPGTSSLAAAVRVAAGATRRAHIATDDKGLLERMRELKDEPSMGHVPLEPPPPPPSMLLSDVDQSLDGNTTMRAPGSLAAVAPSFSEIDQWELEGQMALANGILVSTSNPDSPSIARATSTTAVTSSPSSRRAGTSSNGFPALPAPPLPVSSVSESGDVGYGLGTVWSSLNVGVPSIPSGSSTASRSGKARVPSTPPLDVPLLRPSAPPPMLHEEPSGVELASAPPAWDDEEVQVESIAPEGSTSQEGRAIDTRSTRDSHLVLAVSEATTSNVRQPESTITAVPILHTDATIHADADVDGDGSDADGAESIISTPPDNEDVDSRWSATFRTRAEEGAGLPRYEP